MYIESHWYHDASRRSWVLTKAGDYEPAVLVDDKKEINDRETDLLIEALDKAGWIKPRLDERIRVEDLKITHRLIDLLEKR